MHPDDYPPAADDAYTDDEQAISPDRIDPPYGTAGSGAHAGEARALLDDARGERSLRRIGLLLEALTHAVLATIPDEHTVTASFEWTGAGTSPPLRNGDRITFPAADEQLSADASGGWFEGGVPDPGPEIREPYRRAPDRDQLLYAGGPDDLIAPAPMVDYQGTAVTLFDYVRHSTRDDQAWAAIVADLYTAAAGTPEIAAYFSGVDLDPAGTLQTHFLRALAMVTRNGLTRGTLQRLVESHANVTTPEGVPITGEVFDQVAAALVGSINHRVLLTQETMRQLVGLVEPIRTVLVHDVPTPTGGGNTQWG